MYYNNYNLIGKKAINFNTTGVFKKKIINKFNFFKYKKNNKALLFFFPKNFTNCYIELNNLQKKIKKFKSKNVKILAISTDNEYSHLNWMKISKKKGGIKGVNFPILSDLNKIISYYYKTLSGYYKISNNIILKNKGQLICNKTIILIDNKNFIKYYASNDDIINISIKEILRIINILK
ncbi:MAG: redoxin domain-containing protein [Candidatus Shikimatogenerans sp. Ttur]|uniref:Thioredoxin peroxidase n=1 Tax=Candidatus Shikimatogenerans sp. Ttur TaxID=3158569 RepID=A0AAU7ZXT4_9FLAO